MNTCNSCLWWRPNREPVEQAEWGKYECWNQTLEGIKTVGTFGCNEHIGAEATEVNVPQHTRNGIEMDETKTPVDGPVEIVIVTYWKDMPWLEYCLRSIGKFCSRFQGATIITPNPKRDSQGQVHFIPAGWFDEMRAKTGVNIKAGKNYYDEANGKGMLHHMVRMAEADLFVPAGTKYVMHLDADCIYHTPTTPEDYFTDGKPDYLIRSWDSLTTEDPRNPGSKVISDCLQWREPTQQQLGFTTPWYTMCRHPTVLPIDFYAPYRAHIENVHKQPFEVYMLSGRNEFPQDRMDWTATGAWCNKFMPERFNWIDISEGNHLAPKDRQKTYWSHGGITLQAQSEINSFLK